MIRFRPILVASILLAPMLARADGPVVVRPEPAPGPLDNPFKGWAPYTNAGTIVGPYSMVFVYVPWKELEPEPGKFAFEAWERRAWSSPSAKGKHFVLRVYADYPKRPSGLPDWLRDAGVKLTPYTDHGGGLSPDYDDPKTIAALERLIAAMGKRYDGDPRIALVQLGLLGHWGEWHTYPRDELFASPATQARVIAAYHAAFPRTQLAARTASGPGGKAPWLGYHDDMFPEDTDNGRDWSFLAVIRKSGRADNWKVAPIGGEMVPGAARRWLGTDYDRTLAQVERAHVSWVGPYCPAIDAKGNADPTFRARAEALIRRMGYQFRLDEIRHPSGQAQGFELAIAIDGTNEGVAPFPYPWPVVIALLDPAGKPVAKRTTGIDPRTWLPGPFHLATGLEVPPELPVGRYRTAIGLIDPRDDRPGVAFANRLDRREGWTVLSEVEITVAP